MTGDATKWRLFAAGIDNLVANVLCVLVASRLPSEWSAVTRWLTAAAAYLTYFVMQEATWGTTLGKRLFGLTILRLDGGRPSWTEAAWRTVLRILEVNPLLLGAIPAALIGTWSQRKQRLGDMVAHTVVVSRRTPGSEEATRA
ncbi:MAG: RDD family protein [Acidobacteriota bacterium]